MEENNIIKSLAKKMSETPVLLLIFNRPDVTQIVFEILKKTKPKQLFVAADGARTNKHGEKEKCELTRRIVLDNINWDCDLKVLLRENNLGCKYSVSSAISWFFEQVDYGIILEDDCIPDLSFFKFCEELLERYKDNERVMHISGNYFNSRKNPNGYSYYFSHYLEIWGWATWRRAWKLYDVEMLSFTENRSKDFMKGIFVTDEEKTHWMNCFEKVVDKNLDTWDYQWVYNLVINNGMGITPYKNLVSNIGFRSDATHTTGYDKRFSNMQSQSLTTIQHPVEFKVNYQEDALTFKRSHQSREPLIKRNLKKVLPDFILRAYHFLRSAKQ